MDNDFLWTLLVTSPWVNFRGHFLVNSSGHFLMVITNSANTVGQPTQRVPGKAPARVSEHCSVSRLG